MHRDTKAWRNSLLALLITSLLSCFSASEKEPIPREKMGAILLDIHLAEAYAGLSGATDTNAKSKVSGKNLDTLAKAYQSILAHHQVGYSDFQQALKWYREHPAAFDSVYAWVLPKMDSLKTTIVEINK